MPSLNASVKTLGAALCLAITLSWADTAYCQDHANILIRNVVLVDPLGNTGDRLVNMLVRDGWLEIISEDPIPLDGVELAVDANSGYLLGKLILDEAPNFMILDGDPRQDFNLLLDTRSHASFAMHDGSVVRNQLAVIDRDAAEGEVVNRGWLAYTPPPMAMPVNYRDASKWNRFESRWISGLVTGAMAMDRTEWLSQNSTNRAQFGDLGEFDGGEVRALRFGLFGTLNFETPWVYTIAGATNAFDKGFETEDKDDITLFDWRLDIPFYRNTVISVGKQKEPISMERLTGMVFLPWQERSMPADTLLPSRNVGVVLSGHSPGSHTSWAFGGFNDWLDADESFSESASQLVGRFTWSPLRSEDESSLLHLGVGYRYSDAEQGFRFRGAPEFNKAPDYVDTAFGMADPLLEADRLDTYNLEMSWRRGPFWLASEYFRTDVDSRSYGDPVFDGYYLSASWVLTGEMRPYNDKSGLFRPVPVARSVYQNGSGAWELAARFSETDLDDGAINGGSAQVASLGVNWWLTPFFSMGANYRYIWNELEGADGTSSAVMTRILLMLE